MNFLNFPVILILYFACIHINCVYLEPSIFIWNPTIMAHFFQWQRKDTIEYGLNVFQFELILGLKIKNHIFILKNERKSYIVRGSIVYIVLGEVYHFYGY